MCTVCHTLSYSTDDFYNIQKTCLPNVNTKFIFYFQPSILGQQMFRNKVSVQNTVHSFYLKA